MVRGPLKYRPLNVGGRRVHLPYVHLAAHSYLGKVAGGRRPTIDAQPPVRVAAVS